MVANPAVTALITCHQATKKTAAARLDTVQRHGTSQKNLSNVSFKQVKFQLHVLVPNPCNHQPPEVLGTAEFEACAIQGLAQKDSMKGAL